MGRGSQWAGIGMGGGVRLEQRFPTLRFCDENPAEVDPPAELIQGLSDSRLILHW